MHHFSPAVRDIAAIAIVCSMTVGGIAGLAGLCLDEVLPARHYWVFVQVVLLVELAVIVIGSAVLLA